LIITSTHNSMLFFSNKGKVYKLKAYEIPEGKRQSKGTAIVNLLQLDPDEKVSATIPVSKNCQLEYLMMATQKGLVKKTQLCQFERGRKKGLIAINLREDDELISVRMVNDDQKIALITAKGIAIRFNEKDIRETGRSSMGVRGIRLKENDRLVAMVVTDDDGDLLVVSEKGYGKRTDINKYKVQARGGKGLYTYQYSKETGELIGARLTYDDDELLLINQDGSMIRLDMNYIPSISRRTKGVKLMRTQENHYIISMAMVPRKEEDPMEKATEALEEPEESE